MCFSIVNGTTFAASHHVRVHTFTRIFPHTIRPSMMLQSSSWSHLPINFNFGFIFSHHSFQLVQFRIVLRLHKILHLQILRISLGTAKKSMCFRQWNFSICCCRWFIFLLIFFFPSENRFFQSKIFDIFFFLCALQWLQQKVCFWQM